MEWYWWALIGIVAAWFFIAGVVGGVAEGPGEPTDSTDAYP
jgi:hypothetical protein